MITSTFIFSIITFLITCFSFINAQDLINRKTFVSSNFSNQTIGDSNNFRKILFIDYANFSKTTFKWNVFFDTSIFNRQTNFENAIFDSSANFWNSKFNSWINFHSSSINNIYFLGATFDSNMYFRYAKFNGDVYFNNAVLSDTLHFDNIRDIKKEIDFTSAKTKENRYCHINLIGSDISKIKIDYKIFRLYFPDNFNITSEQKEGVYYSLLEKFKKDGFTESYRLLDLEFKDFQSQKGDTNFISLKRILYYIQLWWWEFGYAKGRIFLWIVVFLFVFSIITFLNFHYLLKNIYPMEFIERFLEKKKDEISKSKSAKYFYSLLCSFVYNMVLFFGLRIEYDKIKHISGWMFYIILVYSLGLICTAYLFNFVISK